jgi:hypothetical protein
MKLTIDVKDDKVAFLLEILKHFSFVKLDQVSPEKERIRKSIKTAMEEVRRAERGELKLQTAQEWLDEL